MRALVALLAVLALAGCERVASAPPPAPPRKVDPRCLRDGGLADFERAMCFPSPVCAGFCDKLAACFKDDPKAFPSALDPDACLVACAQDESRIAVFDVKLPCPDFKRALAR